MEARDIQDTNEIDLMDYIRPLIPRWKLLVLVLVVGGVAAYLISGVFPRQYRSSVVVFVQQSSGAASLLKNLPIPVSGGGGTSSGYITTILQSDSMRLSVMRKLDLLNNGYIFRGKKPHPEKALEKMRKMITVTESKNGSISITATAPSPELAARMANTSVALLDSFVMTVSRKKADFIEKRLAETVEELDRAENDLKDFMERYDVASIDEQTKGMIAQLGELEGSLLTMQAQLEGLSSQQENAADLNRLAEGEVQRKSLQASIEYVRTQRDELRDKLSTLPSIGAKYARLQRNVIVLNKTFELLTEQYQLARVTQKGEDGDYQIIDAARPNPKPVAPRRALAAAGSGLAAFALAAVIINLMPGGRGHTRTTRSLTRPVTRESKPGSASRV